MAYVIKSSTQMFTEIAPQRPFRTAPRSLERHPRGLGAWPIRRRHHRCGLRHGLDELQLHLSTNCSWDKVLVICWSVRFRCRRCFQVHHFWDRGHRCKHLSPVVDYCWRRSKRKSIPPQVPLKLSRSQYLKSTTPSLLYLSIRPTQKIKKRTSPMAHGPHPTAPGV